MDLDPIFKNLAQLNRYVFILNNKKFLNPLIEREKIVLENKGILKIPELLNIIKDTLMSDNLNPPDGMYFPIPIYNIKMEKGYIDYNLIKKYHYNFIDIDENQNWSFCGKKIDIKVRSFFLNNLKFEKSISKYFIEYWNETLWDK